MTQKYYAIVTNLGAAKIANAAALGAKLNITQMAVGDGNGVLPTPNASQTKLVNETRRAALNGLSMDPDNASQIVAEQIIPETEGGFWIREMGLFSEDGTLIAVCNTPETYKPALQEGSGRTQTVRMILIVNSTDAITLKIDPSVVLATRKYVDGNILTVRQYADKMLADHVGADNPHKQYLQIANALAEIKDAGTVADVLKNLGLGEAAQRAVGTGAKQIPDMSYFTFTDTTFAFPNKLALKYGAMTKGAGPDNIVTFTSAFPSNCVAVMALYNAGTAPVFFAANNLSRTGFTFRGFSLNSATPSIPLAAGVTCSWVAIGY